MSIQDGVQIYFVYFNVLVLSTDFKIAEHFKAIINWVETREPIINTELLCVKGI